MPIHTVFRNLYEDSCDFSPVILVTNKQIKLQTNATKNNTSPTVAGRDDKYYILARCTANQYATHVIRSILVFHCLEAIDMPHGL